MVKLVSTAGHRWTRGERDVPAPVSELSSDDLQAALHLQEKRRRTVDGDGQQGEMRFTIDMSDLG